MPSIGKKSIQALMPIELDKELRIYCKSKGYKLVEFIEVAVRNELKRRGVKNV